MSNENITEYYKGFQIVAGFFRNEYQARVQVPGEARLEVRRCSDVQDAIEKAKAIVDEKSEFWGVKEISGTFDLGYSADNHKVRSTTTVVNEFLPIPFDIRRSEMGEALFQLKYRNDYSKVLVIARHLSKILTNKLSDSSLIVPVPPSKVRQRQPATSPRF